MFSRNFVILNSLVQLGIVLIIIPFASTASKVKLLKLKGSCLKLTVETSALQGPSTSPCELLPERHHLLCVALGADQEQLWQIKSPIGFCRSEKWGGEGLAPFPDPVFVTFPPPK